MNTCIILLLSLIQTIQASTEISQCYAGSCGVNALNQGQINHINWMYSACIGGLDSITRFSWNPNPSSLVAGTCTNVATDCTDFALAADEYINAYRIYYNPGINRIYFRTNLNRQAGCGAARGGSTYTDSGWMTYPGKYLSGFQYNAGWILDGIRFQFTAFPTTSPTLQPTQTTLTPTKKPSASPTQLPTLIPTMIPTNVPTYIPTNVPTLIPTMIPTYNPTYIPTIIPTNEPTYEPTFVPTIIPTKQPTNLPTNEAMAENGVVDEISSTQLNDAGKITMTNIKRTNDVIFILIIVGSVVVTLALIIISLIFWKRKRKSKSTTNENRNASEIKGTNTISPMTMTQIASASPVTSDIDDNFVTNNGFFTTTTSTPISIQMMPVPHNNANSLPTKNFPAVVANYANIDTQTCGKMIVNDTYTGEESDEDNNDIIQHVNHTNNMVTAGGNMHRNYATKVNDDDIVNSINHNTKDIYNNNNNNNNNDYDIVNTVNKTHGVNVNYDNQEFEVIDDNIITTGR